MIDASPPFDPPYLTLHRDGSNTSCTETLVDGTTRLVATPHAASSFGVNYSNTEAQKPSHTVSKSINRTSTKAAPLHTDRRVAMYLNVPFAEKENAKQLGAKWDAAKRKWYVPHGVDANLFNQWQPNDLKDK